VWIHPRWRLTFSGKDVDRAAVCDEKCTVLINPYTGDKERAVLGKELVAVSGAGAITLHLPPVRAEIVVSDVEIVVESSARAYGEPPGWIQSRRASFDPAD